MRTHTNDATIPKLQIIFHKRATKYRSLLWKMTYKDKGSYESSPPCNSCSPVRYTQISLVVHTNESCLSIIYTAVPEVADGLEDVLIYTNET